jgi:hypothetical protein
MKIKAFSTCLDFPSGVQDPFKKNIVSMLGCCEGWRRDYRDTGLLLNDRGIVTRQFIP